jgi:hypothetical protein
MQNADMAFNEKEQRRLINQWLRSRIKDFERASELVAKNSAAKLAREVKKQMSGFKGDSKSFKKSVRIRNLRARGSLPFASIVRVGIPWLSIFEEGGTVTGKGHLIILLPEGRKRGLKRITKGNPWPNVWAEIAKRAWIKKVSDGVLILIKDDKGRSYPAYKFQKQVKVPKKLNFYDAARAIGDDMPDEINRLLGPE